MKKQLNTQGVMNELKGGSSFFATPEEAAPSATTSHDSSTSQPTAQSTRQSTEQPGDELSAPLPGQSIDRSPILGRPKAFYITEQQDKDLDSMVSKLSQQAAGKVGQKIDRSTVVRLLLEGADLTNDRTVDRLADQLISRLIRQLTG